MAETEERPKAITSMLQSLNLTSGFLDSMRKLPDAKEIYTEKDFTDIEKKFDETKVGNRDNFISLLMHIILPIKMQLIMFFTTKSSQALTYD